jgi:hypothetical protein
LLTLRHPEPIGDRGSTLDQADSVCDLAAVLSDTSHIPKSVRLAGLVAELLFQTQAALEEGQGVGVPPLVLVDAADVVERLRLTGRGIRPRLRSLKQSQQSAVLDWGSPTRRASGGLDGRSRCFPETRPVGCKDALLVTVEVLQNESPLGLREVEEALRR